MTGDHLRDGVLDLETGVHLEEVELARAIDQELHGPGIHISAGLARGQRGPAQCTALLDGEARRRCLFDQLLMTALNEQSRPRKTPLP